ncbi:hypothetical protein ACWGQ5_16320 [Streptomyces sp. NPDC055722]
MPDLTGQGRDRAIAATLGRSRRAAHIGRFDDLRRNSPDSQLHSLTIETVCPLSVGEMGAHV